MRFKDFARRLLRNTRGATAVEYGLILSLIVLALMGALQTVGNASGSMWNRVGDAVEEVM